MTASDRRELLSNVLLTVGCSASVVGFLTAFSGFGLIVLMVVPVPFSGAAERAATRAAQRETQGWVW